MQPHQRQEHLTTTWEEPQKPPSQHPHGANYAKAVQCQNAAAQFRRIRSEILHSAYRMGQGQLVTEEDSLRLHKAAGQMGMLAADMGRRADHFKNLAATPTPEPAEP
jgi:hypothetical protein